MESYLLNMKDNDMTHFSGATMLGKICNLLSSGPLDNNGSVQRARVKKAEAHRKLALAEWLVKLEARRIALEEPTQGDMQEVDVLTWLVEQRKEQLATLAESFTSPRNSESGSLPSTVSSEVQRFDHYLELPDLVFEKIYSFLEDPQDMLNLFEAIPTQAKRSRKRTKAALEFELEFPEMLRRGKVAWANPVYLDDDDDEEDEVLVMDLRKLACRSKHHLKVIRRHYENILVNDITDKYKRESNELSGVGMYLNTNPEYYREIQQWYEFPELCQISEWITNRDEIWVLEVGGEAIWDFQIWFDQPDALEYSWGNMNCFLSLMPNLRHLEVYFEEHEVKELEDCGNDIVVLPELPFLKSLQFGGYHEPDVFPTCIMLLEKYGGQLNQIRFEIKSELEDIPMKLPPCPKLANLVIKDEDMSNGPETNSEMVFRLLSNFVTSPLKILKLVMNDTRIKMTLYQVLEFASMKFGGTLEHLEVTIVCGYRCTGVDNESSPASYTLLDSVRLPKLKNFRTNVDPRPDGWGYLLLLPSLESLHVDRDGWIEEGEMEDDEVTFRDVDSVKRSKLWEWLPYLEVIRFAIAYRNEQTVAREEVFNSSSFQ